MIGGITIPAFDAAAILIVLAAVLGYINRKRCERPMSREDGGSRSEAARIGASACKRCATGCCGSTATDLMA